MFVIVFRTITNYNENLFCILKQYFNTILFLTRVQKCHKIRPSKILINGCKVWQRNIVNTNDSTNIHEDQWTTISIRADANLALLFGKIKGHNYEVPKAICLFIELGRDIMPINIFFKFHKDRTTTLWVWERTYILVRWNVLH